MQTLWQDLRYGARMLAKKPGFTLIAVVTLALGIGANTALFSGVNSLLLRPVNAAQPDELARVFFGSEQRPQVFDEISWPNYQDLRSRNQSFTDLLGFTMRPAALSSPASRGERERAEVVFGEFVTGNYFDLLGVRPALGRAFLPAEGNVPDTHPVVVISHSLWQRRFNGDGAIIGRTVELNGQPLTVIGIAPADFKGMQYPLALDFWVPLMMHTRLRNDSTWQTDRGRDLLRVVGRLKPGATTQQAEAEMNLILQGLKQQYPADNANTKIQVVPETAARFNDGFTVIRLSSLLALLVAGLVLLIACANVANLLLARAVARSREIGIRLALGAGRGRIVRQLLVESLLLALLGGVGGMLLAYWGADLLRASIPPFAYQLDLDFVPDWRVFRWALLISLMTGVVSGLSPAWHAARTDLLPILKGDSGASTTAASRWRRWNLRNALVVAQIAVSLVVLVSAGLFLRSLRNVQATDPGFRTENLISMALSPGLLGYTPEECKRFYGELARRFETIPGVRAASVTGEIQLSDSSSSTGPVIREGDAPPPPNREAYIGYLAVGPKYFETTGTTLLLGREFSERDTAEGPPVIIINHELARRLYGNAESALGKRIRVGEAASPLREIVGVAATGKYRNLYEDPRPYLYLAEMQRTSASSLATAFMLVSVRSAADLQTVPAPLRHEAQRLDGRVPIADLKMADQHLSWAFWGPRLGAGIALAFGLLALALATMGLYSVMTWLVGQRTREIGIRMALGANTRAVLRLVIGRGMKLLLLGVLLGLLGALALAQVLKSLLLGVSVADPLTFAAITLLLTLTTLLACWIPARRATKVDPMIALRCE